MRPALTSALLFSLGGCGGRVVLFFLRPAVFFAAVFSSAAGFYAALAGFVVFGSYRFGGVVAVPRAGIGRHVDVGSCLPESTRVVVFDVDDVDRDLAFGTGTNDRAQRLRDASAFADDLAEIFRDDFELDDRSARAVDDG